MDYYQKYLKYKTKYINLRNMIGGIDSIDKYENCGDKKNVDDCNKCANCNGPCLWRISSEKCLKKEDCYNSTGVGDCVKKPHCRYNSGATNQPGDEKCKHRCQSNDNEKICKVTDGCIWDNNENLCIRK